MPASDAMNSMAPSRWVGLTLLLTATLSSAAILGTYWLDLFALFGEAQGSHHRVLTTDERWAKYLLSMNYVPANYDGILIGSSKTQNWDTRYISVAHVYNQSVGGGNITEAKAMADLVLQKRKLRLAIFAVWPYMTNSSGFKSGPMTPSLYWSGLGSLRLYRSYADYAAYRLHLKTFNTTESGAERYTLEPISTQWAQGKATPYVDPRVFFPIDKAAYREYGELVQSARKNGATIVRLRPPVYVKDLEPFRAEWDTYNQTLDKLFEPTDPLVDFQAPAHASFNSNRANFLDGAHLTPEAGDRIIKEIDRQLQPLLK